MTVGSRRPEGRIALAVISFLAIHVAILQQAHATAVGIGLIYAAINLVLDWWSGVRTARLFGWLVGITILASALTAIWAGYASAIALLLAPSVLANGFMFLLFGRTLLPGQEPLITRFRRIEIGHVAPKFAGYTRRLTQVWTLLFGAGTAASLLAALGGNIEIWSWIAFVVFPALTAALFLGEHVYRAYRYGPEGRASPLHTLALMFHPQAWLPQPATEPRSDSRRHD
jgi:uncharacterized membrane protein